MLRFLALLSVLATCQAASVQGTVVVERKLTKRNVTASAGLYQRGAAVGLGADPAQAPLDYERSHTVLYLESDSASPLPSVRQTASIEQRDRRFFPDLAVVSAGSTVSFPNFDPVFHNVFSLSKPKTFDLGNYPKGKSREVTLPKTGVVYVYCHLHPNMAAALVVTPNAWNTLADTSGQFTLPDVPPGTYTIVAWHKTGGTFRKKITVPEGGLSGITFLIPLPMEVSSKHEH